MSAAVARIILTRYYMRMDKTARIGAFITRLARLEAAQTWGGDLNPAQIAALDYLASANRFSRAPSQVAAYLGTTRGTMSQTLRALERKGYVREGRSQSDRRSISYDLTGAGQEARGRAGGVAAAVAEMPAGQRDALEALLADVLARRIAAGGERQFGLCRDCAHHRQTPEGPFCALMSLALAPGEAAQICHEQVAR